MIEEYKKNGYVIFDDLLPEEEYKKILDRNHWHAIIVHMYFLFGNIAHTL